MGSFKQWVRSKFKIQKSDGTVIDPATSQDVLAIASKMPPALDADGGLKVHQMNQPGLSEADPQWVILGVNRPKIAGLSFSVTLGALASHATQWVDISKTNWLDMTGQIASTSAVSAKVEFTDAADPNVTPPGAGDVVRTVPEETGSLVLGGAGLGGVRNPSFGVPAELKWARITVTDVTGGQTITISTFDHDTPVTPPQLPILATMGKDFRAALVRSVLSAINADGDVANLVVTADGALKVDILSASANKGQKTMANSLSVVVASDQSALPIQGTVLEDAAHSTGDKMVPIVAVRKDADGSMVDNDGDYAPLQVSSTGRLKVDAAVSGTFTSAAEKTEDSAHANESIGNFILGVRNDSNATRTTADGDYSPVSVDSAGRLKTALDTSTLLPSALRDGRFDTADTFTAGEVLADQNGAGAALTFTFTNPMDLVWVRVDGDDGRADPFGGTPNASQGIICEDATPNPITVRTSTVKVFAPSGATASVWGFRYS